MSATLLLALVLEAVSLVLLRHRLKKTWLRRPVTILVLASVVYQGVSPALLSFPSIRAQDIYRYGIQQSYADEATLITSAAMLAFTIAYLLARPERARAAAGGADVRHASTFLDWRLIAACCVPLGILTYGGRGYGSLTLTSPSAPLGTVLASSFFVLLMALTAFSFVLRHGPGWFLPTLACQSVLLAATGERTPIVTDAIVLIVLLCHAGVRPPARQVQAAICLTIAAVLAVTGARAAQGRAFYQQDTGISARAAALAGGVAGAAGQPLLVGTAMRLDAVDFGGAILQSESGATSMLMSYDGGHHWAPVRL